MSDADTTVQELRDAMREFVAERDWEQFHSPKNLAMSMAIEAAELMEHFQWQDTDASRHAAADPAAKQAIGEELADVLCYALSLSNALGVDLSDAVRAKMAKNARKYPVERYRGRYRAEADP
jgi:NTP pyrophosphatase (non-canonical NTP hydrolase)